MKELAGSFSKVMNESQTEEAAEKGVRTRRRPADLRQGREFGGAPVEVRPVPVPRLHKLLFNLFISFGFVFLRSGLL